MDNSGLVAGAKDPAVLQKSGTIEESSNFQLIQSKQLKGQPQAEGPLPLEAAGLPTHKRAVSLAIDESRPEAAARTPRRIKSRISSGVLPPLSPVENPSNQELPGLAKLAEAIGGLDLENLVKQGMLVGALLQQVEQIRLSASASKHPSEEPLNYFQDEIESLSSGAKKEMEDPKFGRESIFSSRKRL